MNFAIFGIIGMLASAWMSQPTTATAQQHIDAIQTSVQTQVAQATAKAKPYLAAMMEKVKHASQAQPAAVQHSQPVHAVVTVGSPRPVSPRLQAWLEAGAEQQNAERKAEFERFRGSHPDDEATGLTTNQQEF